MADWTKVDKEKEDWEKEDKSDFGWFTHGFFYDWFSGNLWKKVAKTVKSWAKVTK